jgi:hypothetical protein
MTMDARPPYRATPPSQPSPYRRLGGGGGERPVRVQVIIGLVAGLILVAVPLYLWRRPQPSTIAVADAAVSAEAASGKPPTALGPPIDAGNIQPVDIIDAGAPSLKLSPFTTIKCQNPGPGRTPAERCDHVTYFEDALARAIRENAACAPSSKSPTEVSFVMDLDFRRKHTNVFAGKSSSLKHAQTKELLRCVKRAMATPDWGTIPHQYVKYKLKVVATYPPSDAF